MLSPREETAPGSNADGDPARVKLTPLDARTYMHVKSVSLVIPPKAGTQSNENSFAIGTTGLPARVGTVVPGLARILCLAPGEWLLTSAARAVRNLMEHIAGDLPDGLVVVDMSDGLSALEIEGPAARELLSKGCGLDLHHRTFPTDRCARTRFAQVPVVIDCVSPPTSPTGPSGVPAQPGMHRFHLYFPRSYFAYLHSWLLDAAIEYAPAQAGVQDAT